MNDPSDLAAYKRSKGLADDRADAVARVAREMGGRRPPAFRGAADASASNTTGGDAEGNAASLSPWRDGRDPLIVVSVTPQRQQQRSVDASSSSSPAQAATNVSTASIMSAWDVMRAAAPAPLGPPPRRPAAPSLFRPFVGGGGGGSSGTVTSTAIGDDRNAGWSRAATGGTRTSTASAQSTASFDGASHDGGSHARFSGGGALFGGGGGGGGGGAADPARFDDDSKLVVPHAPPLNSTTTTTTTLFAATAAPSVVSSTASTTQRR